MDKLKIADKLDAWVKDNFGNKFYVNAKDGDLNLGVYDRDFVQYEFAWFIDFDTKLFGFDGIDPDDDVDAVIASKGMISSFYYKAIEAIQSGALKEEHGMKFVKKPIAVEAFQTKKGYTIHTLEGDMKANIGDWILTGVDGEQWPVKDEIFKKTYEVADATSVDQLIENVKAWASEREIDKQSADAGMRKVVEELGELSSAYSRNNENDIADSMGDLIVTVVNLSTQMGLNFKDCLALAYDEIKDRNGKVINGTFVKDEDLKNKKDN